MKINKDDIKPKAIPTRDIDATDRRLLRELVDDATLSYAELGEKSRFRLLPPMNR